MEKNNDQSACNGDQHEDPVDNMDDEAAAKEKLTSDPNKVKFTSVNLDGYGDGKNGEAKVDIYVQQTTVGMGKEELMKYANEPFWVRLRMFLFVFFWIAWIAMLVGAVVIILLAPRCPPAPKLDWYQKNAMYQVNVKNYKDSNGDGIGDFKGLISKLDYFKMENIGTLMLSAFYESSDNNAIIDHKNVDSRVGTMADFEELLAELNEKDIKLVVDFNPNHSSDQHQWFLDSVEKKSPYEDFYIWRDTNENNWLNVDGGSAWVYNKQRDQYYLSTFGEGKPDLNLRNENVRKELKDILRFWLEKGVHGFKVVAASHLVEDAGFREEPLGTKQTVGTPTYKDIDHIYTVDHKENLDLFAEWREIVSNFTQSPGLHKILIAELSGSLNGTLSYYKDGTQTLADLAYNTEMTEINEKSTPNDLLEIIHSWAKISDVWPTYLIGSERTKRLANRVGDDLVDAMHMVAIIAKGTPITYYGDELGMMDSSGVMDKSVMLWSNETNAGFSNGSDVSNVPSDYAAINVESQKSDKQSHLNIFKNLLALRSQPALGFGIQEYPIVSNETFSMIRVRKGSPGYLVVVNLSTNSTVVDFSGKSDYLPDVARVEIRSSNLRSGPLAETDHPKISLNKVPLEPKQSVVFSFVPQFKG